MLIAAAALTLLLYLTVARRDAWPFTRYPMFSNYREPHDVRVVCVGLESMDGRVSLWQPHFYRYPDRIGGKLARADAAETLVCVAEVLRLVRLEEGGVLRYRAIHVIERRWSNGAPRDRTVARISLAGQTDAK